MTEENGHWYYIITSTAPGWSGWWKMIYATSEQAAIDEITTELPEMASLVARKFDL
jgi:hypothetical protein